jgi:hypothetical protein
MASSTDTPTGSAAGASTAKEPKKASHAARAVVIPAKLPPPGPKDPKTVDQVITAVDQLDPSQLEEKAAKTAVEEAKVILVGYQKVRNAPAGDAESAAELKLLNQRGVDDESVLTYGRWVLFLAQTAERRDADVAQAHTSAQALRSAKAGFSGQTRTMKAAIRLALSSAPQLKAQYGLGPATSRKRQGSGGKKGATGGGSTP